MKIKVCGIRRLEDARAAVDAGAWALGFIFHKPSKRYVKPEAVLEIVRVLPPQVLTVGVFVDYPLQELNEVVRRSGVQAAQLHGQEDARYAEGVRAQTVIKAFRIDPAFDAARLRAFPGMPILLDTFDTQLAGGTGRTFDWSIAEKAGTQARIILAGGLHPGNIAEAIRAARPWALDVSSGVETSPGVKDPVLLRAFFSAASGDVQGAGPNPSSERSFDGGADR